MRLLVTNDDGIESEGIHVLARALHDAGHEVLVVAPDRDWSGAGAAIGMIRPDEHVAVERVEIPEAPGVEAWALGGPPGMTVIAAHLGAFGEQPELVVSGINAGANTGRSILHSGTVGAALSAQNFGLSGLAVSVHSGPPWRWDTAAAIAVEVLDLVIDAPPRSVLNLNVPALARTEVRGIRWAHLAPFGSVRSAVSAVDGGRLQFELVPSEYDPEPDTDEGLLRAGYASLTTLVGVVEAWPADEHLEPLDLGGLEERIVPGADLHPVHRLPDATEHRSLRRPRLGIG
jgi:5'-nucleotidase